MTDITVIVPTVGRTRRDMLARALGSIGDQNLQPAATIVEEDTHHEGPAIVRNRAVERVETEFIAFLDDDDFLLPNHLGALALGQQQMNADVVWPWFRVQGGTDPFPFFKGRQWNPEDPHQIPITTLIRTSAFRAVGGFRTVLEGPTDKFGNRAGEDFQLWLDLSAAGFKFYHVNEVTWVWCHHGRNSSGLPSRIDWA